MKEQSRDPQDDILPIQFLTRPDRAYKRRVAVDATPVKVFLSFS